MIIENDLMLGEDTRTAIFAKVARGSSSVLCASCGLFFIDGTCSFLFHTSARPLGAFPLLARNQTPIVSIAHYNAPVKQLKEQASGLAGDLPFEPMTMTFRCDGIRTQAHFFHSKNNFAAMAPFYLGLEGVAFHTIPRSAACSDVRVHPRTKLISLANFLKTLTSAGIMRAHFPLA